MTTRPRSNYKWNYNWLNNSIRILMATGEDPQDKGPSPAEVMEVKEDKEVKDLMVAKEVKDSMEDKEVRDSTEDKEVMEVKDSTVAKEVRDSTVAKEVKDSMEDKEVKEVKDNPDKATGEEMEAITTLTHSQLAM